MNGRSNFSKAMSLCETSHLGELEVFIGSLTQSDKEAAALYGEDYCNRFESDCGNSPTALKAMKGSLEFTKPKALPPAIDDNNDQSAFVLVLFSDDDTIMKCCFSHELDEWIDESARSYSKNDVFEWWPLPNKGSGTTPG